MFKILSSEKYQLESENDGVSSTVKFLLTGHRLVTYSQPLSVTILRSMPIRLLAMHLCSNKAISHWRLSFAGIKDLIPQRQNDSYEGFEDLIDRCNVWMKERTDILVVNMQSVIVQQNEGQLRSHCAYDILFLLIIIDLIKLVGSLCHFQ